MVEMNIKVAIERNSNTIDSKTLFSHSIAFVVHENFSATILDQSMELFQQKKIYMKLILSFLRVMPTLLNVEKLWYSNSLLLQIYGLSYTDYLQ